MMRTTLREALLMRRIGCLSKIVGVEEMHGDECV